MPPAPDDFAQRYRCALEEYVETGGETALRRAYELGREALGEERGVLGLLSAYQGGAGDFDGKRAGSEVQLRSLSFLAESLAPFHMTLGGFREATERLRRSLQELELVRDQLRGQNESLATANSMAAAERLRYREMLDSTSDGLLRTDTQGVIREANRAAARLLHIPQAEVRGINLADRLAAEDRRTLRAALEALRAGAGEGHEKLVLSSSQGSGLSMPLEVRIAPEFDTNSALRGLRWIVREASPGFREMEDRAGRQGEEPYEDAADRFQVVASISTELTRTFDFEASLERVARLATPALAECCLVFLFEPGGMARQLEGSADPVLFSRIKNISRLLAANTRPRTGLLARIRGLEVAEEGGEPWIADFTRVPEQRNVLRGMGVACALTVPWLSGNELQGALCLIRTRPGRPFISTDRWIAQDIAQRCALAAENARMQTQLLEERERAAEAIRSKEEFLAVLSHEIRNPLSPVLGWAKVFKSHAVIEHDPFLREGSEALERNAEHIARLVDGCLDLTRVARGESTRLEEGAPVDLNQVDLNKVVLDTRESVRDQLRFKKLDFAVELAAEPLWVRGDATRLQQLVMNLVGNAVKYTKSGGQISLRTSCTGRHAELEVSDTGIGIESQYLEKIFEPFRQGARAWLASDSGIGLGLAIARRIVESYGGSITAESSGLGCGSKFRVQLPLAECEALEQAAPAAQTAPESGRPPRILLIEDAWDILFLLKMELEPLGYSVLTAQNANEGLEIAVRERPDFIVSDIKMPGSDGFELIQRIRGIADLASVPVIALTGLGARADRERALAAGFDAWMLKPVSARELDARIRGLMKR